MLLILTALLGPVPCEAVKPPAGALPKPPTYADALRKAADLPYKGRVHGFVLAVRCTLPGLYDHASPLAHHVYYEWLQLVERDKTLPRSVAPGYYLCYKSDRGEPVFEFIAPPYVKQPPQYNAAPGVVLAPQTFFRPGST